MQWRCPAHPALAAAIVASFHAPPARSCSTLSAFTAAEWRKTWFWLDASGLSLYFLRHAEHAGFLVAVDPETVQRLRQKLLDNSARTQDLFSEFAAINRAFLRHRILFANHKGFTLWPNSCAQPELRLQLDLDFIVAAEHLRTCQSILEKRGYELCAVTPTTWEFKAHHHVSTIQSDPYKPSAHRSVELHFGFSGGKGATVHGDRLERLIVWHRDGCSVPALSPADQLIGQAVHIFEHLRSPVTRPAWLLEFQRHVHAIGTDYSIWHEVDKRAQQDQATRLALAASVLITAELFGTFAPPYLAEFAATSAPEGVRAWIERYGRRAVLADVPGTKLYLLLQQELKGHLPDNLNDAVPGLIPPLRLPQLFHERANDSLRMRARLHWVQSKFILFRARFHIVEGLRYALEAILWKRTMKRSLTTLHRFDGAFSRDDKAKTSA